MSNTKKYMTAAELLEAIKIRPVPYQLPNGQWVEIKALNLNQMSDLQKQGDPIQVLLGAVKEGLWQPRLDDEQLKALYDGNPEYVVAISTAIYELSGVDKK